MGRRVEVTSISVLLAHACTLAVAPSGTTLALDPNTIEPATHEMECFATDTHGVHVYVAGCSSGHPGSGFVTAIPSRAHRINSMHMTLS